MENWKQTKPYYGKARETELFTYQYDNFSTRAQRNTVHCTIRCGVWVVFVPDKLQNADLPHQFPYQSESDMQRVWQMGLS